MGVKLAAISQAMNMSGPPVEKNSLWGELYEKRSNLSSSKRPHKRPFKSLDFPFYAGFLLKPSNLPWLRLTPGKQLEESDLIPFSDLLGLNLIFRDQLLIDHNLYGRVDSSPPRVQD